MISNEANGKSTTYYNQPQQSLFINIKPNEPENHQIGLTFSKIVTYYIKEDSKDVCPKHTLWTPKAKLLG